MSIHRRGFLKRIGLGAAGLSLMPSFRLSAATVYTHLPRSSPEAQGVSSAGIQAFLDAVANSKHEFQSFMMARHGHVIAEGWWAPYRPEANHMLYSLSKSFTSTAVGLAVSEGRLTVDDKVISFFPNKLPVNVDDNLAALKVKHLLTMSVGHASDSTPTIVKTNDWVAAFLSLPIAHAPGSIFLYNSGATYMLSAIVQKLTGQRVIDYLRPRLFDPLHVKGMTWETCPLGINTGGWGLAVQTETLAKFAQLYLQQGSWNDRQIVPAAWVHEATTFKIQQPPSANHDLTQLKQTSDWHQGYCYQFWRCRHNGFRGDGAYGQYAIVLPDLDTVIAATCETSDMQSEINLFWDHLLSAIQPAPMPHNREAGKHLRRTLSSLALPLAVGELKLNARPKDRHVRFVPNDAGFESLRLRPTLDDNAFELTFKGSFGENTIVSGFGKWIDGESKLPGTPPVLTVGDVRPAKVAASAAWIDARTLKLLWRYYETPHHDTLTCNFDGNQFTLTWLSSLAELSNSKDKRPPLRGTLGA